MEINSTDKMCIVTPLSPKLDERECSRIFSALSCYNVPTIGFDFSFVESCSFDFLDKIKEIAKIYKVGFFNIPSDLFAILNFMNLDKTIKLYVNYEDFTQDKHQLINRRFAIV